MTPNATYFARTTFRTLDENDQIVLFEAGVLHVAESVTVSQSNKNGVMVPTTRATGRLINNVTGEIIRPYAHVRRNMSWYFAQVGQMNALLAPKVTQADCVVAYVKGTPGQDTACLFELGQLEGWLPCEVAPPYGGFTTILSKDTRIVPRLNGAPVVGSRSVRGNLRGFTWH